MRTKPPPFTTSESMTSTMRVGGRKTSLRSQKPRFRVSEAKSSVASAPSPSIVTSKGSKRSSSSEPVENRITSPSNARMRSSHVSDSGPRDRFSAMRFSSAAVPLSVSPRLRDHSSPRSNSTSKSSPAMRARRNESPSPALTATFEPRDTSSTP